MFGRKHTPEAIQKIKDARAVQIMLPRDDEYKTMMSEKFRDRKRPPRLDGLPDHHSDESKQKIRLAHLGQPKKKGFVQTEEQKKKKLETFRATIAARKAAQDSLEMK